MTDVLILSGPAGVGKSSTAHEIAHQLELAAINHVVIDTDELDRIVPSPADLARVTEANLAALWRTFLARDARRLVLVGVYLDQPSQLAWIARAVPAATFTLVRLLAAEPTLLARVARREIGSGGAAQLARTRRQLASLSRDRRPEVHVIDVGEASVVDLARRIISLWLPGGSTARVDLPALLIDNLRDDDPPAISAAFAAIGWHKPVHQYEGYLRDQASGDRAILVARSDGAFAGYLVVCWRSDYPPFREAGIPEVQDFNVLPAYRRRGIGSRLMDNAEDLIATRSEIAGIGVGLTADYGVAHQLYVRRGYVPDGRGLAKGGRPVSPRTSIVVGDDLALYLTKRVRAPQAP